MLTDARLTRRALLSAMPVAMVAARAQSATAQVGSVVAPEFKRYADAATEAPVTRLTDPAHTSLLPAWHLNVATRRGRSLLYSNDRTGQMQVYRMDLKSGESHQLTDGDAVRPGAVTLLPDERFFACLGGRALTVRPLRPGRPREVYRVPDEFEPTDGFSVSRDGGFAVLVEKGAAAWRLRRVPLAAGGAVTTIVESPVELRDPMVRPGANEVLYRQDGNELRLASSARSARMLTTASGPALWSPDGATVLYLSIATDATQPNTIRMFDVGSGKDSLVANTSRFVSFGQNADASVFVGASSSKASPGVLLMLRSARRELTLCEHRASDPAMVAPRFTPDSQHILFQSDKHGRMAIYMVNVERFVEKTEE
jgi:oligogalacturonide lyase